MKKDKKRKAALAVRAKTESFAFQIKWEAKKFFTELTPEVEMRLMFEASVFLKMGITDSLLRLRDTISDIRTILKIDLANADTPLSTSLIAYVFGIVPENPLLCDKVFEEKQLTFPNVLVYKHDDETRAKIVDHLKTKGYRMTTYIGQPLLVLPSFRLDFRRKANEDRQL